MNPVHKTLFLWDPFWHDSSIYIKVFRAVVSLHFSDYNSVHFSRLSHGACSPTQNTSHNPGVILSCPLVEQELVSLKGCLCLLLTLVFLESSCPVSCALTLRCMISSSFIVRYMCRSTSLLNKGLLCRRRMVQPVADEQTELPLQCQRQGYEGLIAEEGKWGNKRFQSVQISPAPALSLTVNCTPGPWSIQWNESDMSLTVSKPLYLFVNV